MTQLPFPRRLLLPAIALFAGVSPAAEIVQVSQYSVVEISFTGPSLGPSQNPVSGVDFWADFRHESGSPTYRIHAFWDADGGTGTSGNIWRMRFAPTKPGRWTLIDASSNRSELNNAREGDYVTASSSTASRGFWGTSVSTPGNRWFSRSDGSFQYLVGNTFYDFLSRPNGVEATSTSIRSDIEACAGYFNKVRFCLISPRAANASTSRMAFLTTGGSQTQSVTAIPNPRFYRERVDAAVQRGFELDLVCDLILGGTDGTQTTGEVAFHKYVAARYGAYANVWFTVGQEWDEKDNESGQKSKANQLRGFMAYSNPVSTHGLGNWKSALNGDMWTHSISQGKLGTIASAADFIGVDYARNGGKPAINDENGYDPGEATTDQVLQGILGSFAGGGYGSTGNKTGDKAGGYVWGHAALSTAITDHPSTAGLKFLRQKIEATTEFWKLTPMGQPSSSIFSGGSANHRVLHESGRQYVLASNSASNYSASLPAGVWKVTRLDIKARTETVLSTSASGTYAFSTPSSIAALTVFRLTSGASNAAPQVNAGADQSLAGPTASTTLSGSASDDGLPAGSTLSYQWQQVSGPADAVIAAPGNASTGVALSTAGTYQFRLTVSDGALSGSDTISVVVSGDSMPVVRTVSADLNAARVGVAYADDLEADAGDAPLAWSLQAGQLPPGLEISGSEISGTPTAAGTYDFTVRVSDADGDTDDQDLRLVVALDSTDAVLINFQPTGATVPSGYLADTGAIFGDRGNGRSYGWNVANSANARERNVQQDQRLDTLNHLQKTTGMVWELALADGHWDIEVGCGDPSHIDSINTLTIEGVSAADTDGNDAFDTHTVRVTISDGRLTITAGSGAVNAKLCYLIATPAPAADPVLVNFQPATSAVPAGYLVDSGAVFADRGNGRSYGWSSANATTRERNDATAPDQRYDTLIHLQKTSGLSWELALPNGTYEVRVVCGDPTHADQVNTLSVEGVVVADPDGADRFDEHTVEVTVSDGRLTIAPASGASNAKLCFVEITLLPVGNG